MKRLLWSRRRDPGPIYFSRSLNLHSIRILGKEVITDFSFSYRESGKVFRNGATTLCRMAFRIMTLA
jgi:hypothetical protein